MILFPDQQTYANGTVVALIAMPASDWFFNHWAGDLNGSTNPNTIVMTGNKIIIANFTLFPSPNHPPNKPTITGPIDGKIKVTTDYNFTATDPDWDDLSYFIDWDDGTNSGWIGPYESGETVTKSHTWSAKGEYTIKAKAKDNDGNESEWGELSVTMPCTYNIPLQWFWERFFQRFPNAFPLLRHIMGY